MMKRFFLYFLIVIISISLGIAIGLALARKPATNVTISRLIDRSLDKYSTENLSKAKFQPSPISILQTLKEDKDFTSYEFSFMADAFTDGKNLKKVSGLMNIPKEGGPFPLVVMFRGYVDQKIYQKGVGTSRAGEYFAKNGFITIAPDFLGYGDSDKESSNILESRFQTYTVALSLLNSLDSIEKWDKKNVFLWGHSNGGQITLTILEISGVSYPTVLWAPVSKPFPYSILYYTDESDDGGKLIRHELAKFEDTYDTDLYSIHNYFDRIKAPLQIHQGTGDDAVPFSWSDALAKTLKKDGVEVEYFKYAGSDHNLTPGWDLAVSRSLSFFKSHLN